MIFQKGSAFAVLRCFLVQSLFFSGLLITFQTLNQKALAASYKMEAASEVVPEAGSKVRSYYGKKFYDLMSSPNLQIGDALRAQLELVLNGYHVKKQNDFDDVLSQCPEGKCYRHTSVGYGRARVFLLGEFYLIQLGRDFGIQDVYCNKVYTKDDFGSGSGPAPLRIPDNTVVNVEHTWPQSRFSSQRSKEEQKSDLHHLFPSDSELNSIRGNNPFGEVVRETLSLKCRSGARFGTTVQNSGDTFEPPDDHKGNVARALFYFAVKYGMSIGAEQEATLRKWHKNDPVDRNEYERNNEIFKIQGSLNPFIDHPQAADLISDF